MKQFTQLAKLESLALYFDTDSLSMAGLPLAEGLEKFSSMVCRVYRADKDANNSQKISHESEDKKHQYILKPVSGEGRVIKFNSGTFRTLTSNRSSLITKLIVKHHVLTPN